MVPAEAEILRIAQLVVSATMMFPEPSTARPLGNPSLALVAGPPSPTYPQCNNPVISGGVPASVEMMPVEAETSRTKQLLVSAMKRFPKLSTATPEGSFNVALVAGPPSPEYQQEVPVPATVEMTPVWAETLRILQLLLSAMKMLPNLSTATPLGNARLVPMAGPPSTEKPPRAPSPATTVTLPVVSTLNTRSEKRSTT